MKKCCKNYEEKKACKDCPVLAALRTYNDKLKRREVNLYLKTVKRHPDEYSRIYESILE